MLRVAVTDDGVIGASANRGTGLRGLEDLFAVVHGRFQVGSLLDGGTDVVAEIRCDG